MITKELVEKTREEFGDDGIVFFTKELLISNYGNWSHIHTFGGGRIVMNFLYSTGLCDSWDRHDFDNNWQEVIRKAIVEDYTPQKLKGRV